MAEVDNYYILLDLDPSVDDWVTIEKAIANKKIEWSKNANTGVASKRTEARRLLDLIGDISSVLSDSQNRRDIAGKAKTILENRHRKAFEDLEPVIAMIIAGGGTVTEKQIKSIHQETGKAITIDEIRDFLRKAGITIEGEASPKKKVQKPLIDKSLIKEIRKDLDYLKVKNLYAFLGLDENDLLKTLQEESQNVYRRIMSLPISPEIDAKKRLAGHCQKIFKTEDEKIKYDNTMNEEPLYELEAMIKLAGEDNIITKEEMEQIIELAAKKGVKPEVTIEYVTEYADKKNWKIQKIHTSEFEKYKVCSYCYTLNPGKNMRCSECGESFSIQCPKCGTNISTQDKVCTKCGVSISNFRAARSLVKKARENLLMGNTSEAKYYISRALLYSPGLQEAEQLKTEIDGKASSIDEALEQIEKKTRNREFFSARSLLEKLRRSYSKIDTDVTEQSIKEGLNQAIRASDEGESLLRKGFADKAFDKFEESLNLCRDNEEVKRKLAACPPDPPSGFNAVIAGTGNSAMISWKKSPSKSTKYVILRKIHTVPVGPGDSNASKFEAGSGDKWEDNNPPVGVPVYYVIYSERYGAFSEKSLQAKKLFVTRDVNDLKLTPGDGKISGSWKAPDNSSVIVRRKDRQPPSSIKDGTEVRVVGNSSFTDIGLSNGIEYYYLVVCEYLDEHEKVYSKGVTGSIRPSCPPKPITQLSFQAVSSGLKIDWVSTGKDTVVIYKNKICPRLKIGEVCGIGELKRFGELVSTRTADSDGVIDAFVPEGECYYIPFTIDSDMAIAGKIHPFIMLPELTDIEIKPEGTRFHLLWNWPDEINSVNISWVYGDFSTDAVAGAGKVTRGSYKVMGCRMDADPSRVVTFRLQTVSMFEGRETLSPGIYKKYEPEKKSNHNVQIAYSIKKPFLFFSEMSMTLKCLDGFASGIGVALVGRKGAKPRKLGDGKLVTRVENVNLITGEEKTFSFEAPPNRKGMVLALVGLSASEGLKIIDPPPVERTL